MVLFRIEYRDWTWNTQQLQQTTNHEHGRSKFCINSWFRPTIPFSCWVKLKKLEKLFKNCSQSCVSTGCLFWLAYSNNFVKKVLFTWELNSASVQNVSNPYLKQRVNLICLCYVDSWKAGCSLFFSDPVYSYCHLDTEI